MILRRKFSVPKICCPSSIQATHACHSEVLTRFFGFWSPKPFMVWHLAICRPHVSMQQEPPKQRTIVEIEFLVSHSGLETGLPAFQLPMFSKCDALRKGDLWDMFVKGIHSFCEILVLASTPYQKLEVTESGSTLHQLCMMVASCLEKRES